MIYCSTHSELMLVNPTRPCCAFMKVPSWRKSITTFLQSLKDQLKAVSCVSRVFQVSDSFFNLIAGFACMCESNGVCSLFSLSVFCFAQSWQIQLNTGPMGLVFTRVICDWIRTCPASQSFSPSKIVFLMICLKGHSTHLHKALFC